MNKSSNSDRHTTQRAAALKPVNYLPSGSRKRPVAPAEQTNPPKKRKATSDSAKSVSSKNPKEKTNQRYQVPVILSDSDNVKEAPPPQPTTGESAKDLSRNEVGQADRDEHTDMDGSDQDFGENEDEDQDDGLTDLQGLNCDALRTTFASEQPHWKEAQRNHKDVDRDNAQDYSHFNSDSDGHDKIQDDSLPRKPRVFIGKAKLSKREQDRRGEVPQWSKNKAPLGKSVTKHTRRGPNSNVIELSDSGGDSADSGPNTDLDTSHSQDHSVNKGWPTEAFFVPPKQGSRIISLKDQPGPLKKTLIKAILEVTGNTLFDNAFPSIDENYKYHRKLLRSCARDLKFDQLAERFSRDVDFGIAMARLLQQRISNLRGVYKAKARSRVEAAFLLISNDPDTITKVEHLTQRTEYIFKPNNNGVGYNKLAPFQHPSIIAILQDVIFKGSRGSALSEKHALRFPTLPATGLQPKRRMMSEAMVCMAATAVHAVLDDWRSGREIPSDFNADLYQGVYDSHLEFMRYTREGNLAGYQYMMSKIYNDCCVITSGNVAVSNKAMEILDLHNMPVE